MIGGGKKRNFLGPGQLEEGLEGMGLAGEGEGFEEGVEGLRGLGEARLLRGPVEEAGGEAVVVEEVWVDGGGDEGRGEGTDGGEMGRGEEEAAEGLLEGRRPGSRGLRGREESAAEAAGCSGDARRPRDHFLPSKEFDGYLVLER